MKLSRNEILLAVDCRAHEFSCQTYALTHVDVSFLFMIVIVYCFRWENLILDARWKLRSNSLALNWKWCNIRFGLNMEYKQTQWNNRSLWSSKKHQDINPNSLYHQRFCVIGALVPCMRHSIAFNASVTLLPFIPLHRWWLFMSWWWRRPCRRHTVVSLIQQAS